LFDKRKKRKRKSITVRIKIEGFVCGMQTREREGGFKTVTLPPRPSAPDTIKVLLDVDSPSLDALLAKAP
jgi:hypothetical protein